MAKKKKRKKNYVQKIIPLIILAIMLYVTASFILQFMTGNPPDETLTRMYFLFWTIEIVNLMTIKVSKVRNKYEHKNTDEDEYYDEL
jgi:archaellum biogenesis protein FlaJ (TadC family)